MYSGSWQPGGADPEADRMLAIGYFNALCRGELGDRLVAFTRTVRAVEVGASDMAYAALLPAVRNGELALAVLPAAPVPDLQSAILWTDAVAVAMPQDHRLAGQAELDPAELATEHFLISRQQHGAELHRFLARRVGLLEVLRGTLHDQPPTRLFDRVAAGEGLMLLSANQTEPAAPGVVVLPLGGGGSHFDVRAFWRAADADPALGDLIAVLGSPPAEDPDVPDIAGPADFALPPTI